MIFKYRGFNKNWCFVEGKSIVTARVSTQGISAQSEWPDMPGNCYSELENRIGEETGMWGARFIGEVFMYPSVFVVSVDGETFALATNTATEAYLVNDNGKTVERIGYMN